jgi:two-component system chemotaxis response regulator CheB
MLSSLTQNEAEMTIHALGLGAFDYLSKPGIGSFLSDQKFQSEVIAKIQVSVNRWAQRKQDAPRFRWPDPPERLGVVPEIIAIGASTGGPKALQEMIPELPADLPAPIVVVQHMPPGFTGPFAERLNMLSALRVREARHDDLLEPGAVYIAPAGRQFTVRRRSGAFGQTVLSDPPGDLLHKPSVDALMISVAETFGRYAMGIILTGMGNDGLHGMTAIREAGGLTIGQDESTCTIYGMPRACAENGILQEILPLHEIPICISKALQRSIAEHKLPRHAFATQVQKPGLAR